MTPLSLPVTRQPAIGGVARDPFVRRQRLQESAATRSRSCCGRFGSA